MQNKINFTKQSINSLPIPPPNKRAYYNDTKLLGLQLVIYGSGKKSFVVYKKINGKPTRYKLCSFTNTVPSIEKTRKKAHKIIVEIEDGEDPQAKKRAVSARTATLDNAFELLKSTRKTLKPKTLYDYTRIMEVAFGDWKKKRLLDISKDMVLQRHKKLGNNNGHSYANLSMRFLSSLFNLSIDYYEDENGESYIKSNPVQRISKLKAWYPSKPREKIIETHELEAWFKAVLELKEKDENGEKVADYLITILLTGLRKLEAASLTWESIDLKARTITIEDTKNSETHKLPIPKYLYLILSARYKNAGTDYVFPGIGAKGHLIEPRRQISIIIKASNVDFIIHGLRKTFSTIAERLDISVYALKRLLNHKMRNDVTAGYIIKDVERLREPMQKVEDYILSAAKIPGKTKKVIPFKQPGKSS